MKYEYFVGKRYLFSPLKDRSISVITWISICGVALGNIALISSTSIMNGFRENLRKSVTGSLPHITMFAWEDNMNDADAMAAKVKSNPHVVGAAPYIFKQALITGLKQPKGALLRGIDPNQEANVTSVASFLRESVYSLPPSVDAQKIISEQTLKRLSYTESQANKQRAGIILGATLAQNLNVKVGEDVKLISSEQRMTPFGDMPRVKTLEVIGIFESGISGYDEVLAFVDYRLVQKIYNMGNSVTGIGIKLDDPELAPEVAKELQDMTFTYLVSNWADENKSLFQVMKLEKLGLFLILTLIVIVAAFNIISSLIMLVVEKHGEIAILKSLGASDKSIRKIFMAQGVTIGTIGTVAGVCLGLLNCWVFKTFNIIDIPPGVYPGGDRIPVLINWFDVGLTALCSFMICSLVTIYPATKAAKVKPVDALRYE